MLLSSIQYESLSRVAWSTMICSFSAAGGGGTLFPGNVSATKYGLFAMRRRGYFLDYFFSGKIFTKCVREMFKICVFITSVIHL